MVTPNIDRFAAQGRLFTRHYVQSAVCGPSRCALLTGKVYSSWDCWEQLRSVRTEPQYPASFAHLFRRHGYRTVGIGKISHQPGGVMDNEQKVHQVPFSWDLSYAPVGPWRTPWRAFFGFAGGQAYNKASLPPSERDAPRLPYEAADVPDEGYPDGLNALEAVRQLRDLKERKQPFLLGVGFYKPHLPFNAPRKYLELYGRELPLADNRFPPRNTNPAVFSPASGELTRNHYWPSGPGVVTEKEARTLRRAYFACVSYVDAQIGKVLDEIRRLDLERSTVVVLWSDHGYHLGEHGVFGKQTNYEIAVRSPFIVRTPEMAQPGGRAQALAGTVDVYPTLCELCGIDPPGDLAGKSLVPLLKDPQHAGRSSAFSFTTHGHLLGRTLRTDRYRLVQWSDPQGKTVQVELYDHRQDPDENENIAASFPAVVQSLLEAMPPAETILTGIEKPAT
jgi:arylsulfatase A-like enzyme